MNIFQKKKSDTLFLKPKEKTEETQPSKLYEKEIVYGRAFRWDNFSEELTILIESEHESEDPEYGIVERNELSISSLKNLQGYVYSLFNCKHIPFYVISSETDPKKLSLRLAQIDLYNRISVGDVLSLPISSITRCSIFFKYEQILTICVHSVEISNSHIMDVRDLYHYGDTVEMKIISKDDDNHFINASIKALCQDDLRNYQTGDILIGRVAGDIQDLDKNFWVYFIEISPIISGLVDKSSVPFSLDNNDMLLVCVRLVKEQGLKLKFLKKIES